MDELNCLVMGIGNWGSRVALEYISLLNEGKLGKLYLIDVDKSRLARFKKDNAKQVSGPAKSGRLSLIAGDIRDLKRKALSNIDMAHICTTNKEHYRASKYLLNNNLDLLIEKPISQDIREAEELLSIAKRRKRVVKTGLIFRFDNSIRKIKELCGKNVIGDIYFIRFTWEFLREPIKDVDIVWDLMPHLVDMFQFITGEDSFFVSGIKTQFRRKGPAELSSIVLKTKRGLKGIFNISWFSTSKNRIIEIFGKKGVLRADLMAQTITIFDSKDILKSKSISVNKNNTIKDEALNFIADTKKRRNGINGIEVGLKELAIIDEINKKITRI